MKYIIHSRLSFPPILVTSSNHQRSLLCAFFSLSLSLTILFHNTNYTSLYIKPFHITLISLSITHIILFYNNNIYTNIYYGIPLTHTCMYIYNIYCALKHTLTLPPPMKKAMTSLPFKKKKQIPFQCHCLHKLKQNIK